MPQTLEDHADAIKTRGYAIIEGVLDKEQIASAVAALDKIIEREKEIALKRGWYTSTHTVCVMLLQKHKLFRSICQGPKVLPVMQMLLGKDCILSSLNGLSMTPQGEPQKLHQDNLGIPGAVLTINALHTLDEFTVENGCTRVVPYSQEWGLEALGLKHNVNTEHLEGKAVYLEAPAGSVIAYNGSLLHAGSRNTTDKPRRSLHPFFARSWITPQWDIAASLSPDVINDLTDEQKRLFGFYSRPMQYKYKIDEVMFRLPSQKKSLGLYQRARQVKSWLLKQSARWVSR